MSEREYRRIISRQRYLPEQLRAAEEKVRVLRIEARRLGLTELLKHPDRIDVNAAWDREVLTAKIEAGEA